MNTNNNNTTTITDLCPIVVQLTSDISFQCVLWLEIVLGFVAFLLNCYLLIMIWRVTIFHRNLRLLLLYHTLNVAAFAAATSAKAFYIWAISYFGNSCHLVTSLYQCKIQELITYLPLVNTVYSMLALCLERAYATIRYRTYDTPNDQAIKNWPYLGGCLIACAWLISLANQLLPLATIPRDEYMPICANLLTISEPVVLTVLVPNLTVELATVVLAVTLHFVNARIMSDASINRAMHTLTARFQIAQNVDMNRVLLPSVICHAICFLEQYIFLLLILYELPLSESAKLILVHVNYVWILFYGVVHVILALTRNPHIKKVCRQRWNKISAQVHPIIIITDNEHRRRRGRDLVSAANESNIHFETLERMWTAEKKPRKK